jgi:HAD superfamily hydrolase (TIGR01484 family)
MNKGLNELDPQWIREKLKMVTFDVDGVIVRAGTVVRENIAGNEIQIKTYQLSPVIVEKLKRLKKHVWVNFSSGRALLYLQNMLGGALWNRVSIQSENGSFSLIEGEIVQNFKYLDQAYFQVLTNIREDLKELKSQYPGVVNGFEPKHTILTFHTSSAIDEVKEIVRRYDPEGKLFYCKYNGEAYDIGHIEIHKGKGINFLCEKFKFNPRETITTGDNVNDTEMLQAGVGVSVNPDQVGGEYAIPVQSSILGGEVLLDYLLYALEDQNN